MNVPEFKESHGLVSNKKEKSYEAESDAVNNNLESARNQSSSDIEDNKDHLSLDDESNVGNSNSHLLDSGHFTISPETEHSESAFSGSPRSHSPHCEVIHPQTSMSVMRRSSLGYSEAEATETAGFTQDDVDSICTMRSTRPFSDTSSISLSSKSGEGVEYLKNALNNFNSMYEEKLKIIDDHGAQGDAMTKETMVSLQYRFGQ